MTPPQKFFSALSLIRFSQSRKSQNALNSNGIQFWVHQGGKIRFSVAGRLEALWTFGSIGRSPYCAATEITRPDESHSTTMR